MATPDGNGRPPEEVEPVARRLDDFWDDLVGGVAPRGLEGDLATVVRHVHAIDDARPAAPAFLARLRRELVGERATAEEATKPAPAMRQVTEAAARHDRGALPRTAPIRRWATTHLATAALVLLTLGAVVYVLARIPNETHGPGAGPASPAPSPTPGWPCDLLAAPADGTPNPVATVATANERLDAATVERLTDAAMHLGTCLARHVELPYPDLMTPGFMTSRFGTTDQATVFAALASVSTLEPTAGTNPQAASGGRLSVDLTWLLGNDYIRERWYFVQSGSRLLLDDVRPLSNDAADPARSPDLPDLPGPPPSVGQDTPIPSPTPVYPCNTVGMPPDGSPAPIDPGTPIGTRLDSNHGDDVNNEAFLLAICLAKSIPFDYGGAMTQNYLVSHFGTTDRAAIAAQLATYPAIDPNSVNNPVFVAAGGRVSIDVFWTRDGRYVRERWYFVWYGSKPMLDDSVPMTADASDPARPSALPDLPGPPP
jgi:hypothetical protein